MPMTLNFGGLSRELSANEALTKLARAITNEAYLVGGFIRDILLGRSSRDIDILVVSDLEGVVRSAEQVLSAVSFSLGERFSTKRIVVGDLTVDFSPLYGTSLINDLLRRDFTINSIALPLSIDVPVSVESLIDPSGGLRDLEEGVICVNSENSLIEDPVRILRAFRFSAELSFTIEDVTKTLIEHHASRLNECAGERIREELARMLNVQNSFGTIQLMEKLGVLCTLFPEMAELRNVTQNGYHHLPVFEHSLECVKEFEVLLSSWEEIKTELHQHLKEHFSEVISPPATRSALTKLALLFHDLGKPRTRAVQPDGKVTFHGHQAVSRQMAEPILDRLRMSGHEKELIMLMIEEHLRVGFYCNEAPISPKLIYRYARKLGDATVMSAIHALADARATRGPEAGESFQRTHVEVVNEILWHHFFGKEVTEPRSLLDGNQIIQITGIKEGPEIGEIKEALLEAQVGQEVRTREEAEEFVMRYAQKLKGRKISESVG